MDNININNLNIEENNTITIEEAGCIEIVPIYIQQIRDYIKNQFS